MILKRLLDQQVELVIIGGYAAALHGSGMTTQDVDFCVPFNAETMAKILAALRDLKPTFRQRLDRMPLWDDPNRLAGLRLLLVDCEWGAVDFLKDVAGIGQYPEALAQSETVDIGEGIVCRMLTLDATIAAKRAAGRQKDMLAVRALEVVRRNLKPKTPDSNQPPDPRA